MTSDVEVQDAATVMADEEEAVEHVAGESWDGGKVSRQTGSYESFVKGRLSVHLTTGPRWKSEATAVVPE